MTLVCPECNNTRFEIVIMPKGVVTKARCTRCPMLWPLANLKAINLAKNIKRRRTI